MGNERFGKKEDYNEKSDEELMQYIFDRFFERAEVRSMTLPQIFDGVELDPDRIHKLERKLLSYRDFIIGEKATYYYLFTIIPSEQEELSQARSFGAFKVIKDKEKTMRNQSGNIVIGNQNILGDQSRIEDLTIRNTKTITKHAAENPYKKQDTREGIYKILVKIVVILGSLGSILGTIYDILLALHKVKP